jgi:hypothetical protein
VFYSPETLFFLFLVLISVRGEYTAGPCAAGRLPLSLCSRDQISPSTEDFAEHTGPSFRKVALNLDKNINSLSAVCSYW